MSARHTTSRTPRHKRRRRHQRLSARAEAPSARVGAARLLLLYKVEGLQVDGEVASRAEMAMCSATPGGCRAAPAEHVGRAVKHVLLDLNEIDTDPDVVNQRIHLFRERDVVTRAHRQELLERHRVVLAH